ncbi:anti-sigma factor domain-containing protein [Streptomyces sp. NPDC056402]|uniref:anti-sigma factor n=1 Tax=Streptomyces sp. NPDC056402 TaxID=3345810 RepID=UPI0035E3633C
MNQHPTDVHTLSAAHALNALDPAERAAFGMHLRRCEECRQEAAEFEATAARLAAAASQVPPTAMKRRALSAVDGVRQLPPRVPTPAGAKWTGGRLRRGTGSFVLAACLAAAASFAGLAARQHEQGEGSAQRAGQAEERLDAFSSVLASPDARAAHGKAANGALMTVVSSGHRNKAVLAATGLPAPAPGKTYQLWLDIGGSMRPAGFITGDGTVPLHGSPAAATAVGLTVEPAGGSSRPTTDPLLLMSLPA